MITIALFSIILGFFTLYFGVQKIVFPAGQPIQGFLQGIIRDARRNEWGEAKQKANQLKIVWEKNKYIIALNYGEGDYQLFAELINQLAAAVQTKVEYEAVIKATSCETLWNNFLRIIPEP